jgi:peptidoglycan/LPS O-acetylase OafA/YrhL
MCEIPSIPGRDGAARFHHLDALRGFALLLGVVFHAAQSFGPHNIC